MSTSLAPDRDVVICECFARDGLQHETTFVPTATKVDLLGRFVRAGFTRIESSSYSQPTRVPAFADVGDVMERLPRSPGVAFKNTCPNPRAVERAVVDLERGHGAEELSFLVSASESHSQRNLRSSRDEQWDRITQMVEIAAGRFRIVGVVSVAFGCPFEWAVDPDRVLADAAHFRALGADLVTIGDTIGIATPITTRSLFTDLVGEHGPDHVLAHFHNTRGSGIANAVAALEAGCRQFDTAMGGVGGHPAQVEYGQGLTGNVCTEDLVSLFEQMGVRTGLDLPALADASIACETALGRPLHSLVARAGFISTEETARV